MTGDELYRLATGQEQGAVPADGYLPWEAPMTDEEVLAVIRQYAGEAAAVSFPMRLEPAGDHPGDKVFRVPVPLPDGRYLAVAFSFGQPDADAMANWKPRWHRVDGPATREELEALGRG